MVVLHKVHIQTGNLLEILLVEAFKKEASRITKDLGLEDEQVGDVGGGDGVGHGVHVSSCGRRRFAWASALGPIDFGGLGFGY